MVLLTVPVLELAYSIATYWVLAALAHLTNKTMWRESQFRASPGWSWPLVILLATVCIVEVVNPGLDSPQHIDTKPEQSVLYPSCEPVWLYGTFFVTQSWPRAIIVLLATHFALTASGGSMQNVHVISMKITVVTVNYFEIDMLENLYLL